MDFGTVSEMVETLITGHISSKIVLGVSVIFILLSIKCIFFDEKSIHQILFLHYLFVFIRNNRFLLFIDISIFKLLPIFMSVCLNSSLTNE